MNHSTGSRPASNRAQPQIKHTIIWLTWRQVKLRQFHTDNCSWGETLMIIVIFIQIFLKILLLTYRYYCCRRQGAPPRPRWRGWWRRGPRRRAGWRPSTAARVRSPATPPDTPTPTTCCCPSPPRQRSVAPRAASGFIHFRVKSAAINLTV